MNETEAMDQAAGQSTEPVADNNAETQDSPAAEELDTSDLGAMSQDDQLSALKRAGILGEEKPEPKPEAAEQDQPEAKPEGQPDEDPLVTVKVNGQELQVKQSELIAGYQRQSDYTRKTQELAEERRRYDELLARLATKKEPETPTKPEDRIKEQYAASVAEAERRLGLKPGEFNEFDGSHNFALQQVMLEQRSEELARQQVARDVQEFCAQAQQDPLSPEIDDNFDRYIFAMGNTAEGQEKAMVLLASKARFMSGQATKQDCDILKAHWYYVRDALIASKAPKQEPKKPEPPTTEKPGTGNENTQRRVLNKETLRSRRGDSQFNYLKNLGIFG